MKTACCLLAATLAAPLVALAQDKPAPEAAVQRRVSEDDNVRIEEVRVRGQVRSITVQPKTAGARAYEILPGSAARDPSQPGTTSAGTRVWNLFSF